MFFIPLINISILFFQKDILKIYSQPDAPTNGSILKANTVHRHIESSFINSGHLIEDQDDSHWHIVTSFSILYIAFLLPTYFPCRSSSFIILPYLFCQRRKDLRNQAH